ncbi:hypothetical protein BKA59DRAFT_398320 [Fusarium tricinctum]|uniref:BZIP domain-containing protein n=1 Tax=Fusarium tricinctum TaxID=61284 RepID=A0A8K0WDR3_9HYPO|nr:hypothetical protein BKA59DRAFT_398320 [Fusarium tricinctum]
MAPTSSNPGLYSLPDRNEVQLSAEDDWTRVKGRKEKRRVQNRVAQRSYRSRMKTRLEELQSQLQTYERQKSKGEVEGRDTSPSSPPPSSSAACLHLHSTPPSEHNPGKNNTKSNSIESASLSAPTNVVGAMDPNQYAQAIDQLSREIDLIGNEDSQWFGDSTSLLQHREASSYIQPSISTPPLSIDQSPPMPAYMPEGFSNPNTGPASLSQSILQDFHRFQIQLLAKINKHPEAAAMTRSDNTEELLEAAIAGLEALGFTSVDSFAETYYNSNFDESSLLAGEQSMSRKRRLPRMLSQVLDSAQSWDPWDRRGLNEEVFRTAESLLLAEGKNLDEISLEASINSVIQAAQCSGKATPPQQNATEIKKVLQNELPNLWPMMMALTSGNRTFRQGDRSNLVLAAIIILNCSSKIPKEKLLEFLDVCL